MVYEAYFVLPTRSPLPWGGMNMGFSFWRLWEKGLKALGNTAYHLILLERSAKLILYSKEREKTKHFFNYRIPLG